MSTLTRLLQLWRMYAWLDLLWVTRSFRMFLLYYIGDALINVAAIAGMLLLAERFDGIGPWTKWQIVFMLGYGTLVTGLLGTLFGYNVLFIGRRLGRGQFDHTLIQPQPVWMALLTDGFNPFGSSSTVLCGLALVIWAAAHVVLPADSGLAWPVAAQPGWFHRHRAGLQSVLGQPRVLGPARRRGNQLAIGAHGRPTQGLPARRVKRPDAGRHAFACARWFRRVVSLPVSIRY